MLCPDSPLDMGVWRRRVDRSGNEDAGQRPKRSGPNNTAGQESRQGSIRQQLFRSGVPASEDVCT